MFGKPKELCIPRDDKMIFMSQHTENSIDGIHEYKKKTPELDTKCVYTF